MKMVQLIQIALIHFCNFQRDLASQEAAQSTQRQVIERKASPLKFSQQSTAQAYFYTEIENRPPINFNIPHPPLQTEYPKSIQNNNYNFATRIPVRPTVAPQHAVSSSIPSSLPSIVHQSSNNVPKIQNIPTQTVVTASAPLLIANIPQSSTNAQYYAAPIIRSTYSNRDVSANTREKVIVNVVPAQGWYLNDESERKSYFNAVAHGLLNENGLVYVNNVQKANTKSNVHSSTFYNQPHSIYSGPPAITYSSKIIIPPALLQSQSAYSAQSPIYSNIWPPCAQIPQFSSEVPLSIARQSSFTKRNDDSQTTKTTSPTTVYRGQSSYNVPLKSVGRLAGDNINTNFNLSSLRTSSRTTK